MWNCPISHDEPPIAWSPTPDGGSGSGTWKGGMLGPLPKPAAVNCDTGIELTRVISGRGGHKRRHTCRQ
jgi:hypothetical protein